MILGKPGAVLTAEMFCQNLRHGADQVVSLGKAVSPVKMLQARQVKEENGRRNFLLLHPAATGLSQLKEIRHIRQAGHVIVIHSTVLALFVQKMAERLIQDAFIGAMFGREVSFVGIPCQAQAYPRGWVDTPSVRVQDNIIRIL